MSWEPVNLTLIGEGPLFRPTLGGIVYPACRHVFSGPPEGAKTWGALILALEEIRAGGSVAWIDFEMGPFALRDRLVSLGASDDEIQKVSYIAPETEASDGVIDALVEWHRPTLAIIDAAAGAYSLQGLDDNARREVEIFNVTFIEPFRCRGIATILLDHVTKSAESRGRFAIGSERKIGSCDVHLGFESVVPFGRGRTGLVKVVTHKDRHGCLPRPTAVEIELRSDPETLAVTWDLKAPTKQPEGDDWQPTHQMERVSLYVEHQSEPVSLKTIEDNVTGRRRDVVRKAVEALLAAEYISEAPGNRGARMFSHVRSFTSPDLAPTSPGELAA